MTFTHVIGSFRGGSKGLREMVWNFHCFPDEANIKLIRTEHDPLKISFFQLLEILISYKNSSEKFLNPKIELSESRILKIATQIKP